MQKYLEDIQDYLKSKPGYSIDVFDFETNQRYYNKLTIDRLKSEFESFADLIDHLNMTFNTTVIGIQRFKPNGSSNRRFGTTTQLKINRKDHTDLPKERMVSEAVKGAPNNEHISAPAVSEQPPAPYQMQPPSPFGMGSAFGMSMPDVMNLHTKSSKYDDLKEEHRELKEKNRKLEREKDELSLEIRQLKIDNQLAEKLKELALKEQALKDKPAIDPSVFNRLIDAAENVGATVMANKNGSAPGMAAPDSNEGLSQNKQDLIFVVKSDKVSDEMARELALIAVGFTQNAEFTTAVRKSIQDYKINELV
ncbi:hypothetical protein [uncultured Tenacibaculum sp.]|uniref:hypothetical protein n=1 Tax=uncultured Tenacibaculum sp. TaxID=174713 RepID=UPI00262B7B0E|nr:hypothetical protein [uncultured Tenacibaculum sp.]